MAMTKKEFAARLLFWLLPWPISKILPRSLRIYYWGPAAGPPPGWYDYWGIPGYFWPDAPPLDDFIENPPVEPPPWWPPDAPPLDDFIEDPPVEPPPWWPIDPYDPPPPDQWPEPPGGPTNPSDPYVPGPGPVNPAPGSPSIPYFDDSYWTAAGGLAWNNVLKAWTGNGIDASLTESGTWNVGFRASYLYIEWSGVDMIFFRLIDTNNDQIARVDAPANKVYIPITFGSYDLWRITMDGDTIQIRDIQFI